MIKKPLLIAIICLSAISSMAQKVDLDRHYLKVKYTNLPTQPILDENFRTYAVSSNNNQVVREIKLHGFEKLAKEGTINVSISIGGAFIDNVEITKREKVNKDKEGNVTSTERYYTPVITYTTKGNYKVNNSQGENYSFGLGSKKTHKGREYNTYSKASNYYRNNASNLKDQFRREFIDNSIYQINRKLNNLYGYAPFTYNELFWILDSKKNDDYEGHKKALEDIKTLISKISHDEPLDALVADLKPLEDYFLSILPKYPEDKKRHRKMRYASYYNLGRLYYHFDMPDKAIEYANKIIENDYDKSDGKKLIKQSEALKKIFETNKISSRHFPVETVDNSGDIYEEEVASREAEKVVKKDTYIDVIYNKGEGTIVEGKLKLKLEEGADITSLDLTNFHKNIIKIYYLDDEGEAKNKGYFAKENSFFKANGNTYEAVKFNPASESESQGNVVSLDGARYLFAKVIHKGKKINLYRYKKELVIKKVGNKKGQSTSSLAYTIGFKKKLAKLVEDCPELAQLAKEGSFTNDEDSLLAFVQEYDNACASGTN